MSAVNPFLSTRRDFIRTGAMAAAGTALSASAQGARPERSADAASQQGAAGVSEDSRADVHSPASPSLETVNRFSTDMRDALRPARVTNAMWDFSWLTQHYPGGAFADFDKAADELAERSFNTVRIDAFPLVIGSLKSEDETITISGNPLANWGMSDRDREHAIVRELVAFMHAMKKSGISVILSSWGSACKEHPDRKEAFANDRDGFREAWNRTLDILGSHDALDHVLYVDLDQEFPYFSPCQEELEKLGELPNESGTFETPPEPVGQFEQGLTRMAWNSAQMDYVWKLFSEMLPHFQSRYPRLRFTYSLTAFFKEVRSLGLQLFDVLELHLWIHSPRFDNRSGFDDIVKDRGDRRYKGYARRLAATMDAVGPMLFKEMDNRLAFAESWSEEIAAPAVTTEAWGPWWHMDHPDLDWDWLKDWCAQCMELAGRHNFWGVTPWNYAHPYWNNWSDVEWYREVNERFLKS